MSGPLQTSAKTAPDPGQSDNVRRAQIYSISRRRSCLRHRTQLVFQPFVIQRWGESQRGLVSLGFGNKFYSLRAPRVQEVLFLLVPFFRQNDPQSWFLPPASQAQKIYLFHNEPIIKFGIVHPPNERVPDLNLESAEANLTPLCGSVQVSAASTTHAAQQELALCFLRKDRRRGSWIREESEPASYKDRGHGSWVISQRALMCTQANLKLNNEVTICPSTAVEPQSGQVQFSRGSTHTRTHTHTHTRARAQVPAKICSGGEVPLQGPLQKNKTCE